jgi:hypothetical protein
MTSLSMRSSFIGFVGVVFSACIALAQVENIPLLNTHHFARGGIGVQRIKFTALNVRRMYPMIALKLREE